MIEEKNTTKLVVEYRSLENKKTLKGLGNVHSKEEMIMIKNTTMK